MSVNAGQSITQEQMDALAYMANTMLPSNFHWDAATNTNRNFEFGASGWLTELARIRANIAAWFNEYTRTHKPNQFNYDYDEPFNLCTSGPWPIVPSSRTIQIIASVSGAQFDMMIQGGHVYYALMDGITFFSRTPGTIEIRTGADVVLSTLSLDASVEFAGQQIFRAGPIYIEDYPNRQNTLYAVASVDVVLLAKTAPIIDAKCNPQVRIVGDHRKPFWPLFGTGGYGSDVHYVLSPEAWKRTQFYDGAAVVAPVVDDWRIQSYPCARWDRPNTPFTTAEWDTLKNSMLYSVNVRRAPSGSPSIARAGAELTVEIGTRIAGSFQPITETTILAAELDKTIYPERILFDNQPVYYRCASPVFAQATIVGPQTAEATLRRGSWREPIGTQWQGSTVVPPILAAHYNDTEALLQVIQT